MRGKAAVRRVLIPDQKYGNVYITKFINYLMRDGKRFVAQNIMYDALNIVSEKSKQNPMEIFDKAVKNAMPAMEVKSKRVGGANYQVPMPVRGDRRYMLAFHWIIDAANKKKGRPMAEKLAEEILLAAKGEGEAVKKKMDVQRMADANRAFAHFAR